MIALDEPAIVDEDLFDSPEEMWLSWWFESLKKDGYVKEWRRAPTYVLCPSITVPYLFPRVSTRTGNPLPPQPKKSTLHTQLKYTPDFEVVWSLKAFGLFYVEFDPPPFMDGPLTHHMVAHIIDGQAISTIEVKPRVAGKNTMSNGRLRIARISSMTLFASEGIFTNLVEVGPTTGSIFHKTFTPPRFYNTDKTCKPRTIKFTPRTLGEFVGKTTKLKVITAHED